MNLTSSRPPSHSITTITRSLGWVITVR
jgi:hypothetical protein